MLGKPIPKKLREQLSEDPYYSVCARENEECSGRITWEHACYYSGHKINEYWAIIPLCFFHHLGPGLKKNTNQAIAYSRATDADLQKYSKLSIPHARAIQKLFLPPKVKPHN